ncbi:MAG TPA: ABC transporter permease subunit [Spirochaetia bacterium]|nr:ABC transporter permease subunit [Spirochaetia bacterium]
MSERSLVKPLFLTLFALYMLIPIIATYLFSIAVRWDRTILPEGYTFDWYVQTAKHPYFLITLKNSFVLALYTVAANVVLIIPAAYIAHTRLPGAKVPIDILTILPFGIPRVILALALVTVYTIPIVARSPFLLVCACTVFSMPYMYRPVANSLQAIDLKTLNDAAMLQGANTRQILLHVVGPNIINGIVSGCLLVFSAIFAEYTLARLITGARFKTLPVLLVEFTRRDGRVASSISVIAFTVALLLSLAIIAVARANQSRGDKSITTEIEKRS